jgi:hypothetical protein
VALAKQTSELKQRLSQIVEQAKTQAKQSSGDEKAQIQAPGKLEKRVPLCCQSDGTSGEKLMREHDLSRIANGLAEM